MIPILFEKDATVFDSHGIGDLMDISDCIATANNDGEYEMEFTYPIGAELFNELKLNRIVIAKANHYHDPQAFRIYGYEKTIDGKMKVKCQHISYDLSRIPSYFKGTLHGSEALYNIKQNAPVPVPFNFRFFGNDYIETDTEDGVHKYNRFNHIEPASIRSLLLDGENSIHGAFGGDIVFDNYNVYIASENYIWRRSVDNQLIPQYIVIEYGQNMLDLNYEENLDGVITGVMPFWQGKSPVGNKDDEIVVGDTLYFQGTFDRKVIAPLNLTEYFSGKVFEQERIPDKIEVDDVAELWMAKAEEINENPINITISYVDPNLDIRLCDIVKVRFARMGIDVEAKVTSYTYDVLSERCTEIEIGRVKSGDLYREMINQGKLNRFRKKFLPKDSPYYKFGDNDN